MAQFGIDINVDWECRVGRQWVLGSGSGARGDCSGAMREPSVEGAWCFKGVATGSGAGGGEQTITDCGAHSRGGSGYNFCCCVSATTIWGAGSCKGRTAGSGAGGGVRRRTRCGEHSRCGSWDGSGCCGASSYRGKGGTFVAVICPSSIICRNRTLTCSSSCRT